ncbi:HAD family hydrolase [Ancylobacter defluvii]|uniref:Haloacid dehalogenase n=1 Tax=Ancylobacter defluvii TaxID=1282440 RepID=A0A9W6NCS5_9HYPH|nr:HAD family hydrolase [Ancylobacter defluvii]MBS7586583.1 haloacid dehalogenase-like hydrolase [Ancylobacter defluvii]GLK85871.1 haloacid dehalogenase [Ancylobacter defluvii]
MKTGVRPSRRSVLASALLAFAVFSAPAGLVAQTADPLPSWNAGPAKQSIRAFVERVTQQGGADFVPVAERIAVFDNDGTLWSEQPVYFQFMFALDRLKDLVKANPALAGQEPYKSALSGDPKALAALGEKGLLQIVALTHAGLTVSDFRALVLDWIKTARHPRFDRPYTELVFQPMLELLAYLRANGFKTFIVSGGGVEFMRPWAEGVYGIPPEQVVGSSGKTEFVLDGDTPVMRKLPEVEFIDDGPGKPVGINRFIGRRPVFAAGNSDGDQQMLQWTTLNAGPRFGLIVHHTDAVREWAYDRTSHIGKLDKALDEAPARGWLVVDMKTDWNIIYPFEKK